MLALARFERVVDHSTIPTVGIFELIELVIIENEQCVELSVPPVEDEEPPVAREPPVAAVLDEVDVTPPYWDAPPEVDPPELTALGEVVPHARVSRARLNRVHAKALLHLSPGAAGRFTPQAAFGDSLERHSVWCSIAVKAAPVLRRCKQA